MVAVKSMDFMNDFNELLDRVFDGEAFVIQDPNNRRAVLVPESDFSEMEKARRNAEYIAKIERGFDQISKGLGTEHELIEA